MATDLETLKMLIPVIRQLVPGSVARELVGVQPMYPWADAWEFEQCDDGSTWPISAPRPFRAQWPVYISPADKSDIISWCCNTFKDTSTWSATGTYLYFRDEKDVQWFMLKWST